MKILLIILALTWAVPTVADSDMPDMCGLSSVVCPGEVEPKRLAGVASYYDYVLDSGWSSKGHHVCATRDFPRYSTVLVRVGDKATTCKVTDYGPDASVHPERVIDLSSTAFSDLAPLSQGLVDVIVEQL